MGQMANGRWQIMIHSAVGVPLHSKGLPRFCGPCPSARLSSYCGPLPPRADDDPSQAVREGTKTRVGANCSRSPWTTKAGRPQ
jgi:hypothetical protein